MTSHSDLHHRAGGYPQPYQFRPLFPFFFKKNYTMNKNIIWLSTLSQSLLWFTYVQFNCNKSNYCRGRKKWMCKTESASSKPTSTLQNKFKNVCVMVWVLSPELSMAIVQGPVIEYSILKKSNPSRQKIQS